MQIYINEQELDYTLESEKYFADIYRSVSDWLLQSGMKISSVKINEDEKALDLDKAMAMPIEKIRRIDIDAKKETDDYIALIEYFQLFIQALTTDNKNLLEELQKEFQFIEKVLASYIGDTEDNRKIIVELSKLISEKDKGEKILQVITYCAAKLKDFYKEMNFPKSELSSTVLILEKQLDDYCNISIFLQTGKEKEAYQLILYFIEYAQKIIRIVNYLKTKFGSTVFEKNSEETDQIFFNGFSAVLKELVDAFENEDIIQIGDLMEYEIVPKLKKLIGVIKSGNA